MSDLTQFSLFLSEFCSDLLSEYGHMLEGATILLEETDVYCHYARGLWHDFCQDPKLLVIEAQNWHCVCFDTDIRVPGSLVGGPIVVSLMPHHAFGWTSF